MAGFAFASPCLDNALLSVRPHEDIHTRCLVPRPGDLRLDHERLGHAVSLQPIEPQAEGIGSR
jgi:hypothetical protein